MAQTLKIKDGDGVEKYLEVIGDGTEAAPYKAANIADLNYKGQLDAFGRLRVSQVTTLFDSKLLFDNEPLLWDEEDSGGGETATHSTTTASVDMATAGAGEYIVRQTFQRFNYQSGKSQQIFMTFSGFQAESGVTKRVGYFSSSTAAPYTASLDGIFLENDGTDVYLKVYRSGTEVFSAVQSAWADPLDGSGASGITVDWEQSQILNISFEWLGVGSVFFALVIGGAVVPFYITKNANVKDLVYMSSPNQPLRYEIRQTGATTGSLMQICSTVGTEGGLNQIGKSGHFGKEVTSTTLANTATTYGLLAVRLRSGYEDAIVDIIKASLLETSAKRIHWELHLNATLSAGTWSWSTLTNYGVEYALGNGTQTMSAGTVLAGGYVDGDSITTELQNALRLGVSIAGTADKLILTGRPVAANAVVYSSIDLRQL